MEPLLLEKACVADEGSSDLSDAHPGEHQVQQHPLQHLQGQGAASWDTSSCIMAEMLALG